ncbi:hypothetical protein [Pseudactinotalea sp. Z1748]|uniref:hypothetical protein n=1 Tax=Pseudactinotalea sp. Z1748 TaxID=3413027 RepID=UPI003C7B4788
MSEPALTSRPRRDGTTTARTDRGDFTIHQVLELVQRLRQDGVAVVLRAGVISTDRLHRQGKPPESGLLRHRQRTLATFIFPDAATYDNGVVNLLLERNGWERSGEKVVMSRGEGVVVLILVEYGIDEQVHRRPWWPVEPGDITDEPELSPKSA